MLDKRAHAAIDRDEERVIREREKEGERAGRVKGREQARARTYGKALIIEADTDADGNTAARSAYQIFRDYEVRTCCCDVVCTFPCVNACPVSASCGKLSRNCASGRA